MLSAVNSVQHPSAHPPASESKKSKNMPQLSSKADSGDLIDKSDNSSPDIQPLLNSENANDSTQTLNPDIESYYNPFISIPLLMIFTASMFVCSIGLYIVYRFSILWLPFALYLGWIYTLDFKTPFKGGTDRYWWFRTATFWKYMSSYFPIKLVDDSNGEITRDRNYVFVQNPHGFYCYGAVFNLVTNAGGFREKFPNIMSRISTLGFNFYVPIWREVQLAYGQISVDYNSCKYFLSKSMNSLALCDPAKQPCKPTRARVNSQNLNADENGDLSGTTAADKLKYTGKALIIVVGGAEEAKYIEPNTMDLVLQKRKGFVKLALETGSSLVPVLTFGENDIYAQVPNPPGSRLRKFQDTLQRHFGFTLPLAYGRFLWLVPFKKPLVTVVGRPIHLEKIEKPDREVVEKWHALYIESVKDLYDKWKDVYAKDRKRDLRIVA